MTQNCLFGGWKKIQIFPKWWCNMSIYHDRIHKKNKLKEHMIYSFLRPETLAIEQKQTTTKNIHRTETKKQKTLARALQGTQQAQGHQSSTRQPLDAVFSRIFLSSFVGNLDRSADFSKDRNFPLRDEVYIVLVTVYHFTSYLLLFFVCVFCSSNLVHLIHLSCWLWGLFAMRDLLVLTSIQQVTSFA